MRSHSWRRHNHPFTLSFLEEVLRWVGMNEVHKAVALFLETMAKQPGSPCTQRSEPPPEERSTHVLNSRDRLNCVETASLAAGETAVNMQPHRSDPTSDPYMRLHSGA